MYETIIGLEVHVHLKTQTKAFCGCATQFGNEPNSQVCPVCLGFPGSLPVLNKKALEYAIMTSIALDCRINKFTKFDRKNYFYPDLPKNYQISQYDLPLAEAGHLDIEAEEKKKWIAIKRIHLEEDAGKLIHLDEESLVDFNRSGIPLLEIVSEPEINSPEEAYEYLSVLKLILRYIDISDCDMEKGSLRCDANISIREKGASKLGVKTEIKNMNSFKAVKDALAFERERQMGILKEGGEIIQETRLWDEKSQETVSMRSKEEAQDYRYFPEPDLLPFVIEDKELERIKALICELPAKRLERFVREYGLSEYDAKILVSSKEDADWSEEVIKAYPDKNKKPIVNWIIGPISSLTEPNTTFSELKIPGGKEEFIKLVKATEEGKISYLMAKGVLNESITSTIPSLKIIEDRNLFQVSDEAELQKFMEEVIAENKKSVEDYKSGKLQAIMFLVGQVMKKSKGRANPKIIQDLLRKRLGG